MSIIKLKKIAEYTEGYVNPPVNESSFFSTNGMAWIKVSELIHGSYINFSKFHLSKKGQKLAKNSSQIFKKGTIVWSKSGTVGITSILNIDAMGNRGILNIIPISNKIFNKYLFYFLCKKKEFFSQKATGAVLKHFYGPNLMNETIDLPLLQEQQKIIDIIEPKEKLFLKYSNCVRIENFETVQKDMKNLIDIIEPVEILENIMNTLKIKINKIIESFSIKLTEETNIFKTIETGKLNVVAASKNGKYNFYTAGEKVLKTNNSSFNGRYILLSGNGKLFAWMYDGIFDAYQRVYVLKEKSDFFTTYYSLTKGLENLRQRSNGAVIKFIKKDDILSVRKYSNSHELILKEFYLYLSQINNLLELTKKIKEKLLKLLIK